MENQKTYTFEETLAASVKYFGGDDLAARVWASKFAVRNDDGFLLEQSPLDACRRVAREIVSRQAGQGSGLTEQQLVDILDRSWPRQESLRAEDGHNLEDEARVGSFRRPVVTEIRPQVLECDVVRFQNNKEKWVAFVGLLDGYPYEIFTGLQDDEEGIVLPKNVTKGKIIKQTNPDGSHRYDFQFENKRGYKTTVEGLSEKFNPEYWNYAKLISGVLRYRMPIEHVIKLVSSLQLKSESINTWKNGVERALKKYVEAPASSSVQEETVEEPEP